MEALVSLRLLENPVSNASVLYGLTQGSLIDVDIEILPPADTEPPSVTIAVPADTQNGAFEVVITFTESVSGFEQADITLSGQQQRASRHGQRQTTPSLPPHSRRRRVGTWW